MVDAGREPDGTMRVATVDNSAAPGATSTRPWESASPALPPAVELGEFQSDKKDKLQLEEDAAIEREVLRKAQERINNPPAGETAMDVTGEAVSNAKGGKAAGKSKEGKDGKPAGKGKGTGAVPTDGEQF